MKNRLGQDRPRGLYDKGDTIKKTPLPVCGSPVFAPPPSVKDVQPSGSGLLETPLILSPADIAALALKVWKPEPKGFYSAPVDTTPRERIEAERAAEKLLQEIWTQFEGYGYPLVEPSEECQIFAEIVPGKKGFADTRPARVAVLNRALLEYQKALNEATNPSDVRRIQATMRTIADEIGRLEASIAFSAARPTVVPSRRGFYSAPVETTPRERIEAERAAQKLFQEIIEKRLAEGLPLCEAIAAPVKKFEAGVTIPERDKITLFDKSDTTQRERIEAQRAAEQAERIRRFKAESELYPPPVPVFPVDRPQTPRMPPGTEPPVCPPGSKQIIQEPLDVLVPELTVTMPTREPRVRARVTTMPLYGLDGMYTEGGRPQMIGKRK